MIRSLALAALAPVAFIGAAASPALALETHSIPLPQSGAHFENFAMVSRMMSDSTSETYRMRDSAPDARGKTIVYDLTKGKGADQVDVNSAKENPFMDQPERTSKPAQ